MVDYISEMKQAFDSAKEENKNSNSDFNARDARGGRGRSNRGNFSRADDNGESRPYRGNARGRGGTASFRREEDP